MADADSHTPRTKVYLGLGSNLAWRGKRPEALLRSALADIAALPGARLARVSSFQQTAPWGITDQPRFTNAVARLDVTKTWSPRLLLRELQHIELRHGRSRAGQRYGPRTLDLDILLFGKVEVRCSELTLPHPRMLERAFVLGPLLEIAPSLCLAGAGSLHKYLERL